MARFLIWSDLHDEFHNSLPDLPGRGEVDAVLLAGDVSTQGRYVDAMVHIWDAVRAPVRMVYGNHEFYGRVIEDVKVQDRSRIDGLRAAGLDIDILERSGEIISGTRILGCTLWTDINLYPELGPVQERIVERSLNDFNYIGKSQNGFRSSINAGDVQQMHSRDLSWLMAALIEPREGPVLVMTHHIPCKELLHPHRCIGGPMNIAANAGFASDLWPRLKDIAPDFWVFGHSHDNTSWSPPGSETRFVQNTRGYPREKRPEGGRAFDPDFVLDTEMRPDLDPVPG